jgi:hypothetical protein
LVVQVWALTCGSALLRQGCMTDHSVHIPDLERWILFGLIGHHEQMANSWPTRHFSQANPEGSGQGDVAALLRRVADSIEKLGPVGLQDLILHNEVTAYGLRPSLTVYFQPAEPTLRSVP